MKNAMAKTRPIDNPYEIWRSVDGSWEWRVLKFYKTRERTMEDPCGRVFCAVKSPFTFNSFEMGDTYYKDITEHAIKIK